MDKQLVVFGKSVAYGTILLTIAIFFFRVAVPFTLGMASDLVFFATPLVFIVGVVLLLWLGRLMIKDIINSNK